MKITGTLFLILAAISSIGNRETLDNGAQEGGALIVTALFAIIGLVLVLMSKKRQSQKSAEIEKK